MSSDGSVSSRISQFGLYRTIDARTEEFLKLSKKRQIKQGCVCAAISTALTATVVVTVLLIYEYNVIAEARRSSHKTNWLGVMNNSADDSNLLEILNKEKIDIDKTTLKLLPILLKALRQYNYIDNIIDQPTTSRYIPYEKKIPTETAITKNIFADTRNWMKIPYSRLYTVEYKTSPIVYFKNPTRNTEYFTKIRKIRDYQRILNYVDKMINEKNYLGTTQPMRSDYGHAEQKYKMITPTVNHKPTPKVVNKPKATLKRTIEEKQTNWKCSQKLSEVMYKLLNSIQQLLSYFSGSNLKDKVHCNNITPTELKLLSEKPTVKKIHKIVTENVENVYESKITQTPSYKTFLNRHKYIIDTPLKNMDIRREHTVNAIMNLIKPNFKKHNEVEINFESDEAFSTTNRYEKSPNINTNTKISTEAVSTVADYAQQKRIYDISPDIKSSLPTYPETDFNDDDDYAKTNGTTKVVANSFNQHDTNNLDLVKNNLISERKNISNEDKLYIFKGARTSSKLFKNFGLMRKMGNLVSNDEIKTLFIPNKQRFAPIFRQNTKPTTPKNKSILNKINISSTMKPTEIITTLKSANKAKRTGCKEKNLQQNDTNNFTSKEKIENVSDENTSKEITVKHLEEAIIILNNETTTNQVENYKKILADTYQWEMAKLEENDTLTKSMLPLGRSTYLEMQRNDWKHEENHDYDNDINYIFD